MNMPNERPWWEKGFRLFAAHRMSRTGYKWTFQRPYQSVRFAPETGHPDRDVWVVLRNGAVGPLLT